ncbi:MAG: DUF2163 domain-containing protein [Paracoccaceae bacterium]
MSFPADFAAHIASGVTTVARAILVLRRDGVRFGFTDHDRDIEFGGVVFRADTGFTARALSQETGLSADNTEIFGALRADSLREEELRAGLFDGAEVELWLVNWAEAGERTLIFRGTVGEVSRKGGAFTAELRGLAELLNRQVGRIYHSRCSAVLGGRACGFDLSQPGYVHAATLSVVEEGRVFRFAAFPAAADRWFEKGRLQMTSGPAQGLAGQVKNDRLRADGGRVVELWDRLGIAPGAGDSVELTAGCDKRTETCKLKFNNFMNFRGFPHIPGEDWLMSYPVGGGINDGGSLQG